MCGILFHFREKGLENNDIDYNTIDIEKCIDRELKCSLTPRAESVPDFELNKCFQSLVPKILSRGSDYAGYVRYSDQIEMFSSVLSLRAPFTKQPIRNESYVLQFNGELYNKEIDTGGHFNDTAFIFDKLNQHQDVITTIGLLEGEFAYTIFDLVKGKVYFGKDLLGKKSLSYSLVDGELFVSSCTPSDGLRATFYECVNEKIYVFDTKTSSLEIVDYELHADLLPAKYVVNGLVETETPQELLNELKQNLSLAVDSRIMNIFPLHESSAHFGLLFSGGLDCTLLACMAAMLRKPGTKIDLLNVSFYNPRTKMDPSSTPDRKLSLKSWFHLYKMFKSEGIEFQLIEVDVPYEEYTSHRQRVIELIYPNDTEMDLSIAIAFYFASRGVGNRVVAGDSEAIDDVSTFERVPYTSNCKVLLSGLGADELFGGYTRHERIFTYISNYRKKELKGEPQEEREFDRSQLMHDLQAELQQDLSNLYTRNLARDDKLISSWSKELRYPFLDTHFIRFVTEKVPLMSKLNYDHTTGLITRKKILRELAHELGMEWVAGEAKRAIQFGAKSAKMEVGTGKMKGTDRLAV